MMVGRCVADPGVRLQAARDARLDGGAEAPGVGRPEKCLGGPPLLLLCLRIDVPVEQEVHVAARRVQLLEDGGQLRRRRADPEDETTRELLVEGSECP